MLEYLEKFNNLPAEVREKVSSGEVLAEIEDLENTFGVPLASFVMRVVVGDLYYKNITANLIIEFNLAPDKAVQLEKGLRERVFAGVMDYLAAGKSSRSDVPPKEESPFFGKKPEMAPMTNAPAVRRAPVADEAAKNFLQEDEKDIAAMGKIIGSIKSPAVQRAEIMLAEVVKEANISFPSQDLMKRFREALSTYLRGVRTKVEVRENLLKAVPNGGVNLSPADADRVLNIAQKKLSALETQTAVQPGKVSARATSGGTSFVFNEEEIKRALDERKGMPKSKSSDLASMGARDVEYDLAALAKKKAPADLPKIDSDNGSAAVSLTGKVAPAAAVKKEPEKTIPAELLKKKPESLIPPAAKPIVAPAANINPVPEEKEIKRTAAIVGNKKRMEDVKSPVVMSPIDELAYLDLVNFRRLDPSPSKRAAKIQEKIDLLEKEGIDKKIAGIRAWRTNPVSKTYLSMGQESIVSGKTVDDIIKERKDQGLNYLSKEEFEAVMDLNDNLRF